jgi:hypothetical protein
MISRAEESFAVYKQNDTIGDSDSLFGLQRDCKAVTAEETVLYMVSV